MLESLPPLPDGSQFYSRARINMKIFNSVSYTRAKSSNSYTVKARCGNEVAYGYIKIFATAPNTSPFGILQVLKSAGKKFITNGRTPPLVIHPNRIDDYDNPVGILLTSALLFCINEMDTLGGQPSVHSTTDIALQYMCGLCDDHTYDDTIHVLFVCDKLEPLRSRLYEKLVSSMPCALSLEFYDMCNEEKATLLLSGYGKTCITEWRDLYMNTANYVDSLYKLRSNLYGTLPIDNG